MTNDTLLKPIDEIKSIDESERSIFKDLVEFNGEVVNILNATEKAINENSKFQKVSLEAIEHINNRINGLWRSHIIASIFIYAILTIIILLGKK